MKIGYHSFGDDGGKDDDGSDPKIERNLSKSRGQFKFLWTGFA